MYNINNSSFRSPVEGIDPVTKGKFIIEWAFMMWNDDDEDMISRARGNIFIRGTDNPLYKVAKESALRLQGLVASVTFGTEKKFIRFGIVSDYLLHEDELVNEIELTVVFEILDNLEYLENVQDYKNWNLLK